MADKEEPPAVRVSVTVMIEMSEAQRDAYSERYGVGFVAAELHGRLPADLRPALNGIDWVRAYTTVNLSDARITEAPDGSRG